jgi:5-formyltetrahydrofolate cyclo-ligase
VTRSLDLLRAEAIARRRSVEPADRRAQSAAVTERVVATEWYRSAASVGLYVATGGEIDPGPIGEHVRGASRSTWYPVTLDGHGPMPFRRWDGVAPLERGPLGIPTPPPAEECGGDALDVVLVPLVLFGPGGVRVGRGGGHYDRTFADRSANGGPVVLCGLAYDFQEDATLTAQPWDVPLDVVITPTRTLEW